MGRSRRRHQLPGGVQTGTTGDVGALPMDQPESDVWWLSRYRYGDRSTEPHASSDVYKVNLTLSSGNDPFALTFGQKRYKGFALKLPSTGFQIPTGSLLIAQWWQGAPYVPPVSLHITGDTTSVVSWELWVFNNDTLGNPSSTPSVVGSGTIPFDQWTSIVVMIIPDHTGACQVKMWQNARPW